ncbi:C40 family peptidase [[Mycobacterium] burgundiense]|uniref:C40 family peptidase n=1 Tax=[Mycobacterium] burgundiense TaxID=3064286 RepID=A0ABM9L8C5_9MYCO|nr:C40 family peptidase [Mycolicibacterium sp. MU0053]CAJ1494464.1 C40 family peptidase [Mycolicibacterium sp. MU0053]
MTEVDALARAHQLFAAATVSTGPELTAPRGAGPAGGASALGTGRSLDRYGQQAGSSVAALRAAAHTDRTLAAVIADARRDHADGYTRTGRVLEAARADTRMPADSPVAQREALLRRIARLRAQHGHVSAARRRAALRMALLRALRYRLLRRGLRAGGPKLAPTSGRAALAVRAALSRLGRPYVWGATGPDRFDCSGLMQWSYRQAGVGIGRTTYDQIDDGVAVPRSQIRPGDLVFPHSGHVQMAIGNGMVVEAPHAGATVKISPLPNDVVIRRPLP